MRFLFFILLVSLKSYAQETSSICDSPFTIEQIEKLTKMPDYALTDEVLSQALKDHRLTLVGEVHFYTATSSMQDLITRFRRVKGSNACLAFEFPNVTSTADLYVDKYVNDFKSAIAAVDPKDTEKQSMIRAAVDEYERFQNYFKPLTSLATSLQMKNFCVDSPQKENEEVSWANRNASIAQNLTNLLKSGACSDVLMFIGKEHLTAENNNLKFFLSTFFKQYSYRTINMQMTRETIEPAGRTWNKCASPVINRLSLFKSSLLNTNFRIMPEVGSTSVRFHDFDYVLLLP